MASASASAGKPAYVYLHQPGADQRAGARRGRRTGARISRSPLRAATSSAAHCDRWGCWLRRSFCGPEARWWLNSHDGTVAVRRTAILRDLLRRRQAWRDVLILGVGLRARLDANNQSHSQQVPSSDATNKCQCGLGQDRQRRGQALRRRPGARFRGPLSVAIRVPASSPTATCPA